LAGNWETKVRGGLPGAGGENLTVLGALEQFVIEDLVGGPSDRKEGALGGRHWDRLCVGPGQFRGLKRKGCDAGLI